MTALVVGAVAQSAALLLGAVAVWVAVDRWDRMQDARQELADRLARRPRQTHWQ